MYPLLSLTFSSCARLLRAQGHISCLFSLLLAAPQSFPAEFIVFFFQEAVFNAIEAIKKEFGGQLQQLKDEVVLQFFKFPTSSFFAF